MAISFDQIGQVCATFSAQGDLAVGEICTCTGKGLVTVSDIEERFTGVIMGLQHGFAAVAVQGFVTVPYSGSTVPTYGFCTLTSDGDGKVMVGGEHTYLVVSVDRNTRKVTFLL